MEEDFELTLFDRVEVIKLAQQNYDLENNSYISFSGGKDSTVLHYLIDLALPNNKIPRVFINTGIEYNYIVDFVKQLASNDDRFVIINPTKPIKKVLEEYGYPFKSKEHSLYVNVFQNSGCQSKTVDRYLHPNESRKTFGCPEKLKYQFSDDFKLNISNKCCFKLKKEPAHKWQIDNNRNVTITGMRKNEKGTRANIKGCIITDNKGEVKKFHPLLPVSDGFEEWFISKYNIQLCKLYYPPYNFDRTGCKGCPLNRFLKKDLEKMGKYLPIERKQCETIWKPIYTEYRKLGYRIEKIEKIKLFDEEE